MIETAATYPLDVAKTQQQMYQTRPPNTPSMLSALYKQNKLFAGLSAPLISEVPRRSLKFGCNGLYKSIALTVLQPHSTHTLVASAVLCGGLTGATETVIHTPFEHVKIKVQSKQGMTPMQCAQQLVQEGGIGQLYRGWEAYAMRQFVWNGAFFGMLAFCKECDFSNRPVQNFVVGLLSGSLATILNNPLDVVKTRVQGQWQVKKEQRYAVTIALEILQKEGIRGWSKGLMARLYRSAPGHGLLYMTYELLSGHLRRL